MAREMKRKTTKFRIYVELTAFWGNGDAQSTIKVSRRRWKSIRAGAEYRTSGWSWYEGKRQSAEWSFDKGSVSIDKDLMQCIVCMPVDELVAQLTSSDEV